jgi:hypothetical protein
VRLRLQGDGASWFRTSAWRGCPWPLTDDSRWRRRRGRRVGGGEACRRSRAPWLPSPWCRRGALGQRRLPPGATLLDFDFSVTAPGVPAGAVALHATRHRRLGTVALGSSSGSRLRQGGASTARAQASLLLSFPLLYSSFLHGDGSEEPKGRDPKRDLVCSRGFTWGFATRGGHSDRESAWARAVPSPFALAAKAQGAERR